MVLVILLWKINYLLLILLNYKEKKFMINKSILMSKILMILLWILFNNLKSIRLNRQIRKNKKLIMLPNSKLHLLKLNNLSKKYNLSKNHNNKNKKLLKTLKKSLRLHKKPHKILKK
jgi:hypothetical protein